MKNKQLILLCLMFLACIGCFEDEGNYDYKSLDAPIWLQDANSPIQMSCRAGKDEVIEFKGTDYFKWQSDSAIRAQSVRYEWKLNNVVFGTEADFVIPTDEFIKKVGIKEFQSSGEFGTFTIIEKDTEIPYLFTFRIVISPEQTGGDWMVLSQNGSNSALSLITRRRDKDTKALNYFLKFNLFESVNGLAIPGKPVNMSYTYGANNISELGAITVMTDQCTWEINALNYQKVRSIQEDFIDIPDQLKVVDRQDAWNTSGNFGLHSFLATDDGRIFTKIMGNTNLGGCFSSLPNEVDNKGYKITKFGDNTFDFAGFPCYDEKNRRIIAMTFNQSGEMAPPPMPWFPPTPVGTQYMVSKLIPVSQPVTAITGIPPVTNMPEDTEILHLGWSGNYWQPAGQAREFSVVYNSGGATHFGNAAFMETNGQLMETSNKQFQQLPDKLTKESVVLFAGHNGKKYDFPVNVQEHILYSIGNILKCIDRKKMNEAFTIQLADSDDRITSIAWAVWADYGQLAIGTEKGDIHFYEKVALYQPKLVKTLNVGGPVVKISELDNDMVSGNDHY